MVPIEHARQSVARWGGKVEDYLPIHKLLDSSGDTFGDLRHRTLTHNTWFVKVILEKIFGEEITVAGGRTVSVREIGQWHVMEDFQGGFPSPSDYLQHLTFQPWMNNGDDGPNGEPPPSQGDLPEVSLERLYPAGVPSRAKPEGIMKKLVKIFKRKSPTFLEEFEGHQVGRCGGGGRID